jgi:hypothetical protein
VVSGASKGGGVGMIMGRRIVQRANCWAIGAVAFLAIFCSLRSSANAFEIKRGNGAETPPTDRPPTVIALDNYKLLQLPSGACAPIKDGFEETELKLTPLQMPFVKHNQAYEWRAGNETGTTFWHREALQGGLSKIVIYFSALDLQVTFTATSIAETISQKAIDSGNRDDHVDLKIDPDGWTPGSSFILLNEHTHEGIQISYWSRWPISNSQAKPSENSNIRFSSIQRGTAECRVLRATN